MAAERCFRRHPAQQEAAGPSDPAAVGLTVAERRTADWAAAERVAPGTVVAAAAAAADRVAGQVVALAAAAGGTGAVDGRAVAELAAADGLDQCTEIAAVVDQRPAIAGPEESSARLLPSLWS